MLLSPQDGFPTRGPSAGAMKVLPGCPPPPISVHYARAEGKKKNKNPQLPLPLSAVNSSQNAGGPWGGLALQPLACTGPSGSAGCPSGAFSVTDRGTERQLPGTAPIPLAPRSPAGPQAGLCQPPRLPPVNVGVLLTECPSPVSPRGRL